MISNINNNQFGRTSLSTSTSSSTSSGMMNGANNNFSLDNGFSIYNRNIDFYESFTAAKEVDDVIMKQGHEENEKNSVVSINSKNNNTTIINNNNNIINSNSSHQKSNILINNNTFKSTPSVKTTLISDLNNLHNYSKSPNAIENKPNKSQQQHQNNKMSRVNLEEVIQRQENKTTDDEEEDFDQKSQSAQSMKNDENCGDDKMPDHHARRPMNAFLIFCKRHRSIVRDRHPNLENRSITKILGDWWANLDKDEKQCFTELAKMYKDAFFSANPNFKWYKLPAPPLRTLTTVKSGQGDSPNKEYPFDYPMREDAASSDKDWYSDFILESPPSVEKSQTKSRKANSVGVFKLADETQMGGLSSLLTNSSDNSVQNDDVTQDKEQSLQDALSETSNFIVETISSSRTEPFVNMRNKSKDPLSHPNNVVASANGNDNEISKWKISGQNFEPSTFMYDDEFYRNKKSSRSCKGKRYQEIMKSIAKTGSPNKRIKIKHVPASNKQNGFDNSKQKEVSTNFDAKEGCSTDIDGKDSFDKSKMFDASDFDLEEKIKALPALNLDEYLARKRETKKTKKKIGGRSKLSKTTKTDPKNKKKQDQNNVSGSQKRKAPKDTITRRDVTATKIEDETKIINIPAITSTTAGTSASDLFTLAEVAVQTANIDAPTTL
ncbi:HMG box transcription factor BBX [Culicoides brevitarsis]|uniref:HMG box transcription factor BBX n=1 Tax=Culicoides brevitarsis TaxID=469753 RepID=UPI00307B6B9A